MNGPLRCAVLAVVVALVLSAEGATAREGKFFAAQINYMSAGIQGTAQTITDTQVGSGFNLEETLGVTEDDQFPGATMWFNFGRHSLLLSYLQSSYDGSAVLTEDLLFEDETFPAGSQVESDLKFSFARLLYNYRFVSRSIVDAGLLVGIDTVRGEGTLRSASPAMEAVSDFSAPYPVLGLNVTVEVPETGLIFYVEGSGMSAALSDADVDVLNLEARVTWYIVDGPFGLSAGYWSLYQDIDVAEEGRADIDLSGYYGGIAVRF